MDKCPRAEAASSAACRLQGRLGEWDGLVARVVFVCLPMNGSSREWEKKVMELKLVRGRFLKLVNRVYSVPVSCKWHAPGAGLGMAGPGVLAGVGSQGAGPVLGHGGWRVSGGYRWKIGFVSKEVFCLLKSPCRSSKSSRVA